MIVEIVSIILSSILSLIAVIISIISIKKQTRSQNINASIQLFDKRFEIYHYAFNLWFIVGYFEGGQDLNTNSKHCYQEIMSFIKNVKQTDYILKKIEYAYQNSNKFHQMQKCLFEGKVGEYLNKLLSAFTVYINGIYHKKSFDPKGEETAYEQIIKLYKTEALDMEELRQYIDLSDIKRLDING